VIAGKASKGSISSARSERGRGKSYPLTAILVLLLKLTKNDGLKGTRVAIDVLADQRQKTLRRSFMSHGEVFELVAPLGVSGGGGGAAWG
jgi:hypothetical protein